MTLFRSKHTKKLCEKQKMHLNRDNQKKITNKKIVLLAINNLIKIINTDKPFITQLSIKKNQISFYTISK